MGVVGGNTRIRRWELVAMHQLNELNKNTTVALEQNVAPQNSSLGCFSSV